VADTVRAGLRSQSQLPDSALAVHAPVMRQGAVHQEGLDHAASEIAAALAAHDSKVLVIGDYAQQAVEHYRKQVEKK
jgi:hypothetical protein